MNFKKMKSGFTLIELLVVIAIIGILAALVLVALGNARTKATDSKIKSDIGQLRVLAENIFDTKNGSYATIPACIANANPGTDTVNCGDTSTGAAIQTLKGDITSAGGTLTAVAQTSGTGLGKNFCFSSVLSNASTTYACADSTGKSGTSACTGGGATAASCP